jgi:hypothetical protein
MAEYVTCPACGLKVLTADSLLGRPVRCYGCDARFEAKADPPAPPTPPRPTAMPAPRRDAWPAPPRYRGDEEDDDQDWPFCPGCGRQVSWDDPACPHCGEEFEDEQPPLPTRRLQRDVAVPVRRDGAKHSGGLLLALGCLSLAIGASAACFVYIALFGAVLGLIVFVLAGRDLTRMRNGLVDPSGRRLTRAAYFAGLLGVVLSVIAVSIFVLFG